VYAFDASFFGISRAEAKAMDPSQRLMLEVTYEAFENCGMTLDQVRGSNTSCYVGQFATDYREILFRDPDLAPKYTVSGSGTSFVSNRLSWFFDLKGPSFTLNTACSSSMVALHEACESLRKGESDMSVVGGSNLILSPEMFTFLRSQNFIAPDGKCKSFDISANGYGRGEGVAAIILKPVHLAIRDGDPIRAVIRASGVNQNGRTKGITLPSTDAQIELIRRTYASAGLGFHETTYVDAHGTGTAAGDPIELEALGKTLGQGRTNEQKLLVGSCKPNIGHTEATSGLASLIKGIFALETGLIPPNIYFNTPNPNIKFEEWNLAVPTELTRWCPESCRRMSMCSTGYSGTNAHIVMEDAHSYLVRERQVDVLHFTSLTSGMHTTPAFSRYKGRSRLTGRKPISTQPSKSPGRRLFLLSSTDKEGVKRQASALAEYVKARLPDCGREEHLLCDLAFTLSEKRTRLPWCSYVCATSLPDLQAQLSDDAALFKPTKAITTPRICFCFTGQGAQWASMGKELYHEFAVFRQSVDEAGAFFQDALDCPWDAATELFNDKPCSRLSDPYFAQTLCTVLQIALVDQLASWNIKPDYIIGHSSGEIGGAYSCGALAREDAWKVAYYRGLLVSRMLTRIPELGGGMVAAGIDQGEAQKLIDHEGEGKVVVACVNSPSSVTLSGNRPQIKKLEKMLTEREIFARQLEVPTAYHSPYMEQIASDYVYAILDVQPQDLGKDCTMFSTVTGDIIDPLELGPLYWMKNLISPVCFYGAVQTMLDTPTKSQGRTIDLIIELGPHSTLSGPLKQILQHADVNGVEYTSALSRDHNAVETMMTAVGHLVTVGVSVDLVKVNEAGRLVSTPESPRMLPDLPPYAWNHDQSYSALSRAERLYQQLGRKADSGLLGTLLPSTHASEYAWRGYLGAESMQWVQDHQIEDSILFPAAGYLALGIEAAQQVADQGQKVEAYRLQDVVILSTCVVPPDGDVEMLVMLRPHGPFAREQGSACLEFTISSCNDGSNLRENCRGLVRIDYAAADQSPMAIERLAERHAVAVRARQIEEDCQKEIDHDAFYDDLAKMGVRYGEHFKLIRDILIGDGQSRCKTASQRWSKKNATCEPKLIHPATLDAMFHAIFAARLGSSAGVIEMVLPTTFDEVIVYQGACAGRQINYRGVAWAEQHGLRELMGSVDMFDASSKELLVQVNGARLRSTGANGLSGASQGPRPVCTRLEWQPATDMKAGSTAIVPFHKDDIVLLLPDQASELTTSLSASIHELLCSKGVAVQTVTWPAQSEFLARRTVISLVDLDGKRFICASASDFSALRDTSLEAARLIWVSPVSAGGSIVTGLARSVRNEMPSSDFRCLEADASDQDPVALASSIVTLATYATEDREFRQQGANLFVPRYAPDLGMDTKIADIAHGKEKVVMASLKKLGDVRKLHVKKPGTNMKNPMYRLHHGANWEAVSLTSSFDLRSRMLL
jgi:acyl transferase domain-containing protein